MTRKRLRDLGLAALVAAATACAARGRGTAARRRRRRRDAQKSLRLYSGAVRRQGFHGSAEASAGRGGGRRPTRVRGRDDGAGTPGVHRSVAAPTLTPSRWRIGVWRGFCGCRWRSTWFWPVGAAVVAWSELLPLRRTEIMVRADPSDRLYRIQAVVGGVAGLDLAMEAAARRFVRIVGDRQRDPDRAVPGGVQAHGRRLLRPVREGALRRGRARHRRQPSRSITVESIDRIETGTEIRKYAVDLVQTDERGGAVVGRKSCGRI